MYASQKTPIENCSIKYSRRLLGVPKHTDNSALYGELGNHPLYIDAVDRMLKYWHFIEHKCENALLLDAYACVQELHKKGCNTWLAFANNIKKIKTTESNGKAMSLTEVRALKTELKRLFAASWEKDIMSDGKSKSEHGRKLRTYRKFKHQFGREQYLGVNMNPKWRVSLTRFRVSAHRLMIEMGRRTRTDLELRLCPKCDLNKIEDEWHFLTDCPLYAVERQKLMHTVKSKSPLFHQLCEDDQMCWLMSNGDNEIILALAEYVYTAMSRRHPGPTD